MMIVAKLVRIAGLLAIALGTMAPDTVAPIITDSVTQTNDGGVEDAFPTAVNNQWGGMGPSGRPWHTSNYVLGHEFRTPEASAIVDAMPTPVNGQITDTVTPLNGQITD